MRAHDWSTSPLGAPATWPRSLRSAVSLMLANRHLMFVAWGPELAFLYNDGYRPVFGAKHPWALGRPFREVWSEIWDDIAPLVDKAMSGEATWSENLHLVMERNGYPEDTWYTFSYSPIRDSTGAVAGMFCAGTETTAQVQVERRLRESEARFRNMADHAPVMMWVTDPTGHCSYLNRAWYDFTGQTREEAEGFGWLEATHPDDRAATERIFVEANAAHRAFRSEYRLRRADGTYRWALDAAAPRFGEDGAFLGYVGSVIDIDERREAEDRARAAEERYRALFETMDEGFCVIEFLDGPHGPLSDYVHVEANRAYATHTGIPNVVGQKVREMVPAEADGWVPFYRNVLLTGEPIRFERELVATGRHLDLAAFRVGPVERRQVAVLFQDVTARKRAEDELRTLNTELAERVRLAVAEREAALARLHESQKLETLGQLTGGVAHDFNNLLTPIVGALDLVSRRLEGDERARRLTAGALQAADRARILVQRLLAFSRRQHLEARAVDLGRLVTGMSDLIARSIGPQIRLTVACGEGRQAAQVDPNQFELALLNLAVNARDAMPAGGDLAVRVERETVGRHPRLAPGDYVRVTVTDSGIGMDEATLRRAVEPFFTTKEVGRGTGLGLPSVHGLAAQSGGSFALTSRPGFGTTATLWLPAASATAPLAEEAVAAEEHRPPPPPRPANILLVDDEELVRHGIAEMLSGVGYSVREAASARQALSLIEAGAEVDAIVTDYAMPGMNGVALAEEARRTRPGLPVLMITGFASVSDLDASGVPRLGKPFRQNDLALALAALL